MIQILVQLEAAHATVDELGELGLIQFKDLNPTVTAFQRNFINEVKRADEMERKIRFFEDEINKLNEEYGSDGAIIIYDEERQASTKTMVELASHFDEKEAELIELNKNQESIYRQFNQLIELEYVLRKDESFFAESGVGEDYGYDGGDEEAGFSVNLKFKSGVISKEKFILFERILFRVTRGNLFMKHSEIEETVKDPVTGVETQKVVFIVFYQGERLDVKIKKICEALGANIYPIPENSGEREDLLKQVEERIEEAQVVIDNTMSRRRTVLSKIARKLKGWRIKVKKEKGIHHTLNKFNFDGGRKCLIAEGWCPSDAIDEINIALRNARERSNSVRPSVLRVLETKETHPTYFKKNKVTTAFQSMVDSYGIPRYQEVNPAVFTIITFPFQFGIMFGDVGHGVFLLAFTLVLLYNEKAWSKQKLNEILEMMFNGRYILLLMSLFAIYAGAIYNEVFAIPVDVFGTNWIPDPENNMTFVHGNRTYPFGIDPAWKGKENELLYFNSLKMKMSVIVAVLQMSLGLCLKCLNGIHYGYEMNIIGDFFPQIVFLLSIFGYLCFLIFYKFTYGHPQSPLLLIVLIWMFLPGGGDAGHIFQDVDLQMKIQSALVIIALICVPIMLIPKPLVLYLRYKSKLKDAANGFEVNSDGLHGHDFDHFSMSEIIVHQVLETIEFVLGTLSHTASYLRLWALSLAHSELATVFWEMLFAPAMVAGAYFGVPFLSAVGGVIGFAAWLSATIFVLLGMESLSAFLHALRLHWVEFQSKFFHGDGIKFQPFTYKKILSGKDEEQNPDQ
jgi:V-type H+-transporting ATPase subunit a